MLLSFKAEGHLYVKSEKRMKVIYMLFATVFATSRCDDQYSRTWSHIYSTTAFMSNTVISLLYALQQNNGRERK